VEKIICKNCGDIFEDYKSNKKKFCSKKCYYESIKNKIPWNLGKKYKGKPRSEETKKKIGEKNKISLLGNIPWNKGKSGLQVAWNKGLKGFMAGNKHYNWNGGQDLIFTIRNCFEYRQWRSDIFTRDNFTCQDCGDNSGGNLNAHHKKRFIDIINQYNIKTIESALACNELWNINNGITLCEKCHRKVIN
jgi:hypothetical protein